MKKTLPTRRGGYTLLEIAISLSILIVIFAMAALVARTGSDLFTTSVARNDVESRARRTLARIQKELLSADHTSLDALATFPSFFDSITFDQVTAVSATHGVPEWTPSKIEFRYEDGEPDDGIDNDGDGLIDEGAVVFVKDWNGPDEQQIVLCHDVSELAEGEEVDGVDNNGNQLVDERGLSFSVVDGSLVIRLTLGRIDKQGRLVERTFESSVWLRN